MNEPANLRYTKDHEWARASGSDVTVGITAFAVEQLGDVTLVTFDVKVGDAVVGGQAFGTVESVKTLSDLYAPISGTVVRLNDALTSRPELVNDDCYGEGWMIVLAASDAGAVGALMDAAAYGVHVKSS
ncbi:MAG: glycine cleavage system protein GcvH [Polyangiaceae bacterium]